MVKRICDLDRTQIKNDFKCINYITAYLFFQALNYLVKLSFGEFAMWGIIAKGFLTVFMLNALWVMIKKKFNKFLVIEILCFLGVLNTYLMGDYGTTNIGSILFNLVVVFIPLAFSVVCIKDYSEFLNKLYIVAWPISIILVVVSITQNVSVYDYNMALSYALLLQVLVLMDHYIEKHKIYDLLAIIVLFILIIIGGSRGSIFCFGVYIVFELIFSKKIQKNYKILFTVLIVFFGMVVLINLDSILLFLINILENQGISSRNLYYLYNKNFSDSGRRLIITNYINKAIHGPIFGFGIAGGWINSIYPHNIFVEFLLSYGVVAGIFLSVLLIWIVIRGFCIENQCKHRLVLIFVAYSMSLLISNSYVLEPLFFITIPLCLSETKVILGRRK